MPVPAFMAFVAFLGGLVISPLMPTIHNCDLCPATKTIIDVAVPSFWPFYSVPDSITLPPLTGYDHHMPLELDHFIWTGAVPERDSFIYIPTKTNRIGIHGIVDLPASRPVAASMPPHPIPANTATYIINEAPTEIHIDHDDYHSALSWMTPLITISMTIMVVGMALLALLRFREDHITPLAAGDIDRGRTHQFVFLAKAIAVGATASKILKELEICREAHHMLQRETENLQKTYAILQSEKRALEQQYSTLRGEHDQLHRDTTRTIGDLRAQTETLTSQKSTVQQQHDELRGELEETCTKNRTLLSEISDLKQERDALSAERDGLATAATKHKDAMEVAWSAIKQHDENLALHSKTTAALKNKLEESEKSNKYLEAQVNAMHRRNMGKSVQYRPGANPPSNSAASSSAGPVSADTTSSSASTIPSGTTNTPPPTEIAPTPPVDAPSAPSAMRASGQNPMANPFTPRGPRGGMGRGNYRGNGPRR